MKTLTNLTIVAAAVAALAGSASAQNLTAEIPFAFRAGATHMAPGAYRVSIANSTGHPVVTLRNDDNRQAVMIVNFALVNATPREVAEARAVLAFECAGGNCVLRDLKTGGSTGYHFYGPKPQGEELRIAHVALTPTKAD